MSVTERKINIGRSRELLCAHVKALKTEVVPIQVARGRILQETVSADRDLPPFDRVTMDGIAICWVKDVQSWSCVGTQFAGDAPLSVENGSECVEIMTGARLPMGADTVIPVEWIKTEGSRVSLRPGNKIERGLFVHGIGSDSRTGDVLINPGVRLSGRHLALCASVGKTELKVSRLPKIAYLSTGNELVAPDQIPGEVEMRRSNDHAVSAECAKLGIELHANLHLKDDPELIEKRLLELEKEVDLIVFSGGVSMGKADYIPSCAEACGFEIVFHKVMQKPGGPILFAKHPSGRLLLGLPGNPLSCMVCARLYLRQILEAMTGYPMGSNMICTSGPFPKDPIKTRLQPVRMENDPVRGRIAKVVTPNTSGDMLRVLDTDGFVLLPTDNERAQGETLLLEYLDWEL